MSKYKVLVGLTGSIACYKTCALISKLVQNSCDVKTICTKSALEFVGVSTLRGLTSNNVYIDMFDRKINYSELKHIELAKWYDLAIVCPASANIINKFHAGIADDLLSTMFLAQNFSKPFLIAPAMNKNMYSHPSTQKSLKVLSSWGAKILETESGHQACGDVGAGRLLNPDEIFKIILSSLEEIKC